MLRLTFYLLSCQILATCFCDLSPIQTHTYTVSNIISALFSRNSVPQISQSLISESLLVSYKQFKGVPIHRLSDVSGSKNVSRTKRSMVTDLETPAQTTTNDPPLYNNINRNKTDAEIVIEKHSFVCGRTALCRGGSLSRMCSIHCLSCYCDDDCLVFGDCCPDFHMSRGIGKDILEEFESCVSYERRQFVSTFDRLVMVALCPANFTSSSDIVDKCENANSSIQIEATPVTDQNGVTVYKNIFCAACHGASNTSNWLHDVTCKDGRTLADAKTKEEMWSKAVAEKSCEFQSYPLGPIKHRRCYPSFHNVCNVEGNPNAWMKPLCDSYTNPVWDIANNTMYRNIFCALCHGVPVGRSGLECGDTYPNVPFDLSVLLKFTPQPNNQKEDTIESCKLGEIEDPLTGNCLLLQCTDTHILDGNECTKRFPTPQFFGIKVDTLLHSDRTLLPGSELDLVNSYQANTQRLVSRVLYPALTIQLYIRVLDYHPFTMEQASIAFVRTKFLSGKALSWSEMEVIVKQFTSVSMTVQLDGIEHIISASPATCSVPDWVTWGGTYKIKQPTAEAQAIFGRMCETNDCIKNAFYIAVGQQPACQFVSYNMTGGFTYNASTNDITYKGNSFNVSRSDVNQCGDLLNICSTALANIPQIITKPPGIHKPSGIPTDDAKTIISLVCLSISLLGLFLTFCMYASHPKLRNVPGQIILFLVAYLFLAQFLFLLGSNWTDDRVLCQGFGIAIHFFWVASFSWMTVSSVHMMRVFTKLQLVTKDQTNGPRYIVRYAIASNCVAMFFVGVCLAYHLGRSAGMETGYGGNVCFLNEVWSVGVFFATPLLLMLFINTTCFVKTIIAIKAVPDMSSSSNKAHRSYILVYFKLSILLGFSWVFGITGSLLESIVLTYIFIVLTGSQGIFIFTSYCLTQRVYDVVKSNFSKKNSSGSRRT